MRTSFTVGIDYGTNSVRAVVVDCAGGRVLGTAVSNYASWQILEMLPKAKARGLPDPLFSQVIYNF